MDRYPHHIKITDENDEEIRGVCKLVWVANAEPNSENSLCLYFNEKSLDIQYEDAILKTNINGTEYILTPSLV
jgi:hypothetical protein